MTSPGSAKKWLIEIAWEVCHQVGGIYTVLRTKVPSTLERWNSNYLLIGPYHEQSAAIEFEEAPIEHSALKGALEALNAKGLPCYYGRWLVKGRPQVVLVDYRARFESLDQDKYFLWKDHGISSPSSDSDINNSIAFGYAVTELLAALCAALKPAPIAAQFHEWQAAVPIPRLKQRNLPISTIFITHATQLGRCLASERQNFYNEIESLNPHSLAIRYGIEGKHLIERVAAITSDVFATISEITAIEASKFLGRQPEVIVPNGINAERFTALHEFQNLHLKYKERIHEFIMGHFFPSYPFDLDRVLYLFTSGRYEYRNKGMDLFIEALHRLNLRLREVFDPPTVVGFIVTRAAARSINVAALQRHAALEDLKNIADELNQHLGQRLLEVMSRGEMPQYEDLLPRDFQVRIKRALHARRASAPPPIATHDLQNDWDDAIMKHLRHRQLLNSPGDAVKVIFHADFLNSTSPLFNLDYDQFVRGCHIGVFPSCYEPWGYTPLECLALGIPTVTTDLAGFGRFVLKNVSDPQENGVLVLKRMEKSDSECIDDLTDYLFRFIQLDRRDRIELRNRAERLSLQFDWKKLSEHYIHAQELALKKRLQA